jgi:hypothetical protein
MWEEDLTDLVWDPVVSFYDDAVEIHCSVTETKICEYKKNVTKMKS